MTLLQTLHESCQRPHLLSEDGVDYRESVLALERWTDTLSFKLYAINETQNVKTPLSLSNILDIDTPIKLFN